MLEKAPLFALSVLSSVATLLAQQSGKTVASLEQLPLPVRAANAAVSSITYLWETVWPRNLAAFYPHPGSTLPVWQVTIAIALLAAISALAIALRKRHPCVLSGWLWYAGTIVPVVGLVQVGKQAMADRYTYVPLIGIFAIVAWSGAAMMRRLAPRGLDARVLALPACAVIVPR